MYWIYNEYYIIFTFSEKNVKINVEDKYSKYTIINRNRRWMIWRIKN